jgi:hypothetical protein
MLKHIYFLGFSANHHQVMAYFAATNLEEKWWGGG